MALRLKALRDARGWTQQQLADKAGLTREYVARLETGRQDPRLATVSRLARAFGVPVTELLA